MKFIFTIYLLIKIHYPSNDLETVRFYNELLDRAMKTYCFAGVEYDLTVDRGKADFEIFPVADFFYNPNTLGFTESTIHYNPKIYDIPRIRLSRFLEQEDQEFVLRHEIFHVLGGGHSLDTLSLMNPTYTGLNRTLSRSDSIIIKSIIDNLKQ